MSEYEVLKPFNIVNRKLVPGSTPASVITDADDLSPFTLDERVKGGFLREKGAIVAPAALPPNKLAVAPKPPPVADRSE